MNVYVARQPIFDRLNEVVAYELLYRDSEQNFYNNSLSDSVATSVLILNSYLNIGMSLLTDNKRGFINFGPNLILDDIPNLLSQERIVIELLESVKPDDDLVRKLKELRNQGHIIALDDYVYGYPYTELVDQCHIVKVDFLLNTHQDIRKICKELSQKKKLLLAEKVETKEDFEWAKQLGFDYFQGYFFAKPSIISTKSIDGTAYNYLQILEELECAEPDYSKISQIIETEIPLAYKLLKLVNSSFSFVNDINSIQHCLSILGINAFSKWFNLVTIHQLGSSKPNETVKLGIFRMRFFENLGLNSHLIHHCHSLRLIGLLSILDCLMEKTMDELLDSLPIAGSIKNTLLFQPTPFTGMYKLVLAYEKGDFDRALVEAELLHINATLLPKLYQEAVTWSEDITTFLTEQEIELEKLSENKNKE